MGNGEVSGVRSEIRNCPRCAFDPRFSCCSELSVLFDSTLLLLPCSNGSVVTKQQEIAKHRTPNNAWMVYRNKVYDVSGWHEVRLYAMHGVSPGCGTKTPVSTVPQRHCFIIWRVPFSHLVPYRQRGGGGRFARATRPPVGCVAAVASTSVLSMYWCTVCFQQPI